MNRQPLIDADGEVRELNAKDLAAFRPAKEALSPELYATLTKGRGPQKSPLKIPTTIRFDADVLDALKASGKGWQTRVNDLVRASVRLNSQT